MSVFNQMTRVALKMTGLLLLVSLGCLAVDYAYRHQYRLAYPWPEHLLIEPPLNEPYQIVKVGNSHAQDAISFRGYQLRGLDLSGVAQRFSYDLVMLKQHHKQIADEAIIFIAVTPISFSHRPALGVDGLQYNYHGRVAPWLIPDLRWGDYVQSQLVPFVRSGYLWRTAYGKMVTDRVAAGEKWEEPKPTPMPTAEPAKSSDGKKPVLAVDPEDYYYNVTAIESVLNNPPPMSTQKFSDNMSFLFTKWYETDEFGVEHFTYNQRDLENLIAYCLEQNWRPVLVTVPITQILIDGLLDDYMQTYLYDNVKASNTQGVPYYDYSSDRRLTENIFLFANADHMNDVGRAVFSYVLLQDLTADMMFDSAVDGYDYGPLYLTE